MYSYPNSAFDPSNGDFYISDTMNYKIRRVVASTKIETYAGAGTAACNPDSITCFPSDGCLAS